MRQKFKSKIAGFFTKHSNSEFKKWSNTGRLLKGLPDISGGYLTFFTMPSAFFGGNSDWGAGLFGFGILNSELLYKVLFPLTAP
jgi:hypothetical protein